MRILIHGGFGFVGGRLAQHFQQLGHQVIIGTRNNRKDRDWPPNIQVVNVDYFDELSLKELCSGVDVVIQAAGMNASDCSNNPTGALEVNGLATSKLLDAAIQLKVKRFIYLSTAHVYANPLIGKFTENCCTKNLHPYATSHVAGENVVLRAAECKKIEGVILRLSNVVGMPTNKNVNCWMLLINDLCKQAVIKGRLVLTSNGLQQRNFITLRNLLNCLEYFSFSPSSVIKDGLFNVGGEESFTVYDISKLVAERCQVVLGFTPTIERIEPKDNEISAVLDYDVTKLRATGFTLQDKFEDEIDELLTFCARAFGANE